MTAQILTKEQGKDWPSTTPFGVDLGFMSAQGAFGMSKMTIPSLITPLFFDNNTARMNGAVQYLDSSNERLKNTSWATGENAFCANTDSFFQAQSRQANTKIESMLPLFLGLLAHEHARDRWNLQVVASYHQVNAALRRRITEELQGIHHVVLRGEPSTVKVNVLAVVAEGSLAVASMSAGRQGSTVMTDLGGGTIDVSYHEKGGNVINRKPFTPGVNALISAICSHQLLSGVLGSDANPYRVRLAIENRTFKYSDEIPTFESAYRECLIHWAEQALHEPLAFVRQWEGVVINKFLIGGGALLPGIADFLPGFSAAQEPQWVNVKSLLAAASHLSNIQES